MKRTLLILALTGLAGSAHAATWTLGDTTVAGLRTGVVALTDGVGAMGTAGDALFGSVTNDLNEIDTDAVAVGSWDFTSAVLGGNAIDLGLSHEIYAGNAYLGDTSTAFANLLTSASVDNATLADAGLDLEFSGFAPARLNQRFVITPELGEQAGDLVMVNVNAWATHALDGNLNGNGISLDQDFLSSYSLALNGTVLDADSYTDLGNAGKSWSFQAHVGDELSLQLRTQSQVGGTVLAMAAGATPEVMASSEAFLSMSVTAVPEPEAYALLLAGLGLVGLVARRRGAERQRLSLHS